MKNVIRLGTMLIAATLLSLPTYAIDQTNGGANGGVVINAGNGGRAVPEIDAAGATLAFALLGGIVAIARERRRRKR